MAGSASMARSHVGFQRQRMGIGFFERTQLGHVFRRLPVPHATIQEAQALSSVCADDIFLESGFIGLFCT